MMIINRPLFMPSLRRVATGLLIAVAATQLVACAANQATGRSSFTAFMSEEDELRVGAEEHPKILQQFGGEYIEIPGLNAYIQNMGMELAALSEKPNLPYQFTVLNDEAINAFALPGGYIYITRGLLSLADTEAEVAGVLSHEIGHVTARHTAERYSQAVATSIGANIIGIIGGAYGLRGVGQAAGLGAQLYVQSFSREQELESDLLGTRYMTRAGYDPSGLTSFFKKLKGQTELQAAEMGRPELADQYSPMSTHPRTDDRIIQATRLAAENPVPNARHGRDTLLQMVDGIIFRDDPKQGIRNGRLFQHPGLKLQFEAPPEFVLINSQRNVTAVGPEGSNIIFDAAPPSSARPYGDVKSYLVREWAPGLNLQGVQEITVNGLEAATAAAQIKTNNGPRDVRLIAFRENRDTIYRFAFLSPPSRSQVLEEDFRRMTYSFRLLSDAEAAAIKPMRIRITAVQAGDTVESLSAAMPMERFKIEWFELLNAVERGKPLVPGAKIKIVTQG